MKHTWIKPVIVDGAPIAYKQYGDTWYVAVTRAPFGTIVQATTFKALKEEQNADAEETMMPLYDWIVHTPGMGALERDILVHIQECINAPDSSCEERADAVRCIMTSIRQTWEAR